MLSPHHCYRLLDSEHHRILLQADCVATMYNAADLYLICSQFGPGKQKSCAHQGVIGT